MGTHAGEADMAQWRGNVRSIVLVAMLSIRVSLPAAAEVISESVPFVSPKGGYVTQEEGYHTFRIPGMIVTQDGSVLVFAEGRRGDGSDPRRDEDAPIDEAYITAEGRTVLIRDYAHDCFDDIDLDRSHALVIDGQTLYHWSDRVTGAGMGL